MGQVGVSFLWGKVTCTLRLTGVSEAVEGLQSVLPNVDLTTWELGDQESLKGEPAPQLSVGPD